METVPESSRASQTEIAPSWLDLEVSIVASAHCTKTTNIRVVEALDHIRNGKYRAEVQEIRIAADDQRKILKKALPAVMWSGTFRKRANAAIIAHSGLLCADLDDIPPARLSEIRTKLATSRHVIAIFASPTGSGLKVLFKVRADANTHKASFFAVQSHVRMMVGLPIDRACSDVARLCFTSFDPALWMRPDQPDELTVCTHSPQMPHKTHTPHISQSTNTVEGLGVVSLRDATGAVEIAVLHRKNTSHRNLCKLAGALLAVEQNTGSQLDNLEVCEAFDQWHALSLPFLNPKQSKDDYLLEFLDARANVKNPLQKSAADVAWERAANAPIPPEAVERGLSDPPICRMIAFCRELQLLHGNEPFFLSPYTVQRFFNQANHSTAAYWLGGLCELGILTKIAPGSPRVWAASYKFNFVRPQ